MAVITLTPPPGQAAYREFQLSTGAVVQPDFTNGSRVAVASEADAVELENEGWLREPVKMAAAPIFAKAQRRANLNGLAKHSPALAKACADVLAALDALEDRTAGILRRLTPPAIGVWKEGIANGAQHRGVHGLSAERAH
jgi:hypothetical protein